jgi:hypothetical protein
VEAARVEGVRVNGLGHYRHSPRPADPALLLAFGNLSEHPLVRGVHAIAEAVRCSGGEDTVGKVFAGAE